MVQNKVKINSVYPGKFNFFWWNERSILKLSEILKMSEYYKLNYYGPYRDHPPEWAKSDPDSVEFSWFFS